MIGHHDEDGDDCVIINHKKETNRRQPESHGNGGKT